METRRMERSFYLLAYDISDNRRRQKIAKACESLAERVQYSVFEAYLTPPELDRLLKRTIKLMNTEEDSLRVYSLCSACRKKARTHGVGRLTEPPGLRII